MEKRPLFSLPCPSTAITLEPTVVEDDQGLWLSLDYDDNGRARKGGLLFIQPRAFRRRQEIYCTAWHVKDAYDTVCEIGESDWVAELKNDAVPEWRDRWVMRHFMIYLQSFGCLEVVAESLEPRGELR